MGTETPKKEIDLDVFFDVTHDTFQRLSNKQNAIFTSYLSMFVCLSDLLKFAFHPYSEQIGLECRYDKPYER